MDFSRELLFFFSALGVFNATLLTLYFLFGGSRRRFTNLYLGLLMLALSIRIGKSVFLFFNRSLSEGYIHLGLMGCLAIGPLVWYFLQSQVAGSDRFRPTLLIHLLPVIGLGLFAELGISYRMDRALWQDIIWGIYLQWGVYAAMSLVVTWVRFLRKQNLKDPRWTLSVVTGVFLVWLAYVTSSWTSYIVGALLFTFVVYMLIWILVVEVFRPAAERRRRRKKPKLPEAERQDIQKRLEEALTGKNRYRDPNLSMPELAAAAGLTPHQLSDFLNRQMGVSFSRFINGYRIREAREKLAGDPHLTVEAIAYECGFNATSTFYAAFKEITGQTPAAYRKQLSD
jgi:AraC-like DNA-binding protein